MNEKRKVIIKLKFRTHCGIKGLAEMDPRWVCLLSMLSGSTVCLSTQVEGYIFFILNVLGPVFLLAPHTWLWWHNWKHPLPPHTQMCGEACGKTHQLFLCSPNMFHQFCSLVWHGPTFAVEQTTETKLGQIASLCSQSWSFNPRVKCWPGAC